MPRKPKGPPPPTVAEILAMGTRELARLNLGEMRKLVNVLVSAGNKRIRRLQRNESKGIAPEALRGVMESGGVFSARGKNRNQLFKELTRARNFFNSPLSTVKGAMEERKRRERSLYGETREERAKRIKTEQKETRKAQRAFKKSHKDIFNATDKDKLSNILLYYVKMGLSPEEAAERAYERFRNGDASEPDETGTPDDDNFRPHDYESDEWDPEKALKDTFRAYRMFCNAYPHLAHLIGSDRLIAMMGSYSQMGLSPEESIAKAYDEIMSYYEDMESARTDADNWEWTDDF